MSEQLKIVIFRILQEGLHNIVKHAKADTVRVELAKRENDLRLTIEDNGLGFSLEKINSQRAAAKGLGLTSMRERAGLSGGRGRRMRTSRYVSSSLAKSSSLRFLGLKPNNGPAKPLAMITCRRWAALSGSRVTSAA